MRRSSIHLLLLHAVDHTPTSLVKPRLPQSADRGSLARGSNPDLARQDSARPHGWDTERCTQRSVSPRSLASEMNRAAALRALPCLFTWESGTDRALFGQLGASPGDDKVSLGCPRPHAENRIHGSIRCQMGGGARKE